MPIFDFKFIVPASLEADTRTFMTLAAAIKEIQEHIEREHGEQLSQSR